MNRLGLVNEVFKCMHCEGTSLPFKRHSSGKFYRFPPIIGASGNAPLLFVGINPRASGSNVSLHESIVENRKAFKELSANRVGKHPYIGKMGLEPHYNLHVSVTEALFPGVSFETVAAVTELHFCASADSSGLPAESSKCADRFLSQVLEVVSPSVVFAIGRHVERVLQARARSWVGNLSVTWPAGVAPVLILPHPSSYGPKQELVTFAVAAARRYLRKRKPPAGPLT